MPSLACPQCKTKLTAPAEVLGQTVRCTRCGMAFQASTVHSPYLEDLPEPPRDWRPYMLGGAALLGLLITVGMVLVVNGIDGNPNAATGPVSASPMTEKTEKPKILTTADGVPIDIPDGSADRMPPPGMEMVNPTIIGVKRKPLNPLDDVTLSNAKWDVAPGVRTLQFEYFFHNNQSPGAGLYVLKIKMENQPTIDVPIEATWPAEGRQAFNVPATLSDGGRLKKVELWIERATGTGLGQKVSNTVSTQ